jgi:hypothetical protein
MKTSKLTLALQSALLFGALSTASAHVSYNGRDFGSYSGFNTNKVISNQYVTSDYGWADATDADLGDSHKTRAFKFSLSSNAWVTLRFEGLAYTSGATSYSALALPAFSLYSGLAAAGTHDGSPISIAWRDATYGTNNTKGSLNALGDWKIGSDAGTTFADLSSLTYIGNAADGTSANYGNAAGINGDGNADGVVTGSFYLGAGDYSVFIGGANYSGVNTNATYGIQGSFTAVPEPSTWALLSLSLVLAGVMVRARRQRVSKSVQQ